MGSGMTSLSRTSHTFHKVFVYAQEKEKKALFDMRRQASHAYHYVAQQILSAGSAKRTLETSRDQL